MVATLSHYPAMFMVWKTYTLFDLRLPGGLSVLITGGASLFARRLPLPGLPALNRLLRNDISSCPFT